MRKTPVAKLLLGVLAASFILWGIRDVFRNGAAADTVIQAGSRSISTARFRQMFQDELKQYNQQSGQTVSLQDAVSHNIDRQVADAIASDEALAAYIQKIGIRPADKQIADELAKAPRFFNPGLGPVRQDRPTRPSSQQLGMTDQEFERLLGDEIAQTQFVSGIASGLRAPLLFSALQAAYDGEGRSFRRLRPAVRTRCRLRRPSRPTPSSTPSSRTTPPGSCDRRRGCSPWPPSPAPGWPRP